MAGKRRRRAWAELAIALVPIVALGYPGGSNKAAGSPEAMPDKRKCTQCKGTMRLKDNGDYVCDRNGEHRIPAQQAATNQ